jgi:hypothetical protein
MFFLISPRSDSWTSDGQCNDRALSETMHVVFLFLFLFLFLFFHESYFYFLSLCEYLEYMNKSKNKRKKSKNKRKKSKVCCDKWLLDWSWKGYMMHMKLTLNPIVHWIVNIITILSPIILAINFSSFSSQFLWCILSFIIIISHTILSSHHTITQPGKKYSLVRNTREILVYTKRWHVMMALKLEWHIRR